jgi:Uri superfamily endonuclease
MERVTNFELPATHGTYALHIVLTQSQLLIIGRLGRQRFPGGHYFYVGSARGPGGLRSRVGRHVRGDGQPHWHIDYLRACAEVRAVFYTVTDTPLECAWCQAVAQLPQAFIPVAHFGASDCRSGCAAHLIGFPCLADVDRVPHVLAQITPTPIETPASPVR